MDKLEIRLGVLLALLSMLSILFILSGVVPSPEYPDHYTYGRFSEFSEFLMPLCAIIGFVIAGHGLHKEKLLETLLGILIVLWGSVAWFWVNLSFYDARIVYIKGSVTDNLFQLSLAIAPGIVLGLAVFLDGRRKHPENTQSIF